MKTIFIKALIILSVLFILYCCNNKEEEFAGIMITFEGIEGSEAWVIETAKNDTSIHLDTIEYGLMSKVNGYSFILQFKNDTENGDYLIFADSINQVNIISNVEVSIENDHYFYTFQFNGEQKSSKNKEDLFLIITRENE